MATATYQYQLPSSSSLQHGRLHRRTTSSSSLSTSTFASPTLGNATFSSQSDLSTLTYAQRLPPLPPLITRPTAPRRKMSYEEYFDEYTARAASPAHGGSSFKIKPYLRKLSLKDDMRIDLSKPAAENESLTGISMGQDPLSALSARSATEPNFPPSSRRGHGRSGSNTSQYSVASALQRPTAPYAPMRATPRPFTPPIATSASTSVHELTTQDENMTEEEFRYQQNVLNQIQRRGSAGSNVPAPKLHQTRSTSSLSRYNNNASRTSLALTNPTVPLGVTRSRGNTLRSTETTNTTSTRPSIDKTFSTLLRTVKSDDSVAADPHDRAASRAASIRAARQAYYEREQKKDEKEDAKEMKRRSKEEKRLKRRRAKSDATALEELRSQTRAKKGRKSVAPFSTGVRQEGMKARSRSQPHLPSDVLIDNTTTATTSNKSRRKSASALTHLNLVGQAYDLTTPSNMPAMGTEPLPSFNEKSFYPSTAAIEAAAYDAGAGKKRSGGNGGSKVSKDRWLSFMAWFRTRLLRMSDGIQTHH